MVYPSKIMPLPQIGLWHFHAFETHQKCCTLIAKTPKAKVLTVKMNALNHDWCKDTSCMTPTLAIREITTFYVCKCKAFYELHVTI